MKTKLRSTSGNISMMFLSTAIAMIVTEITGVITVLIDGIISSRFLGVEVYSGISLLKPFSGIVSVFTSLIATGCNIVCSRLIGLGKKEETNRVFNLSVLMGVLLAGLLTAACLFIPTTLLHLCGVSLNKYPELNPYLFAYLHGYMIGIPFMILIQIISPVLVMNNGKRLFTVSSLVLCITDILSNLLNIFVFHGGAFGIGIASSLSYLIQFMILLPCFLRKDGFFRLSPKAIGFHQLKDIVRYGSPALIKRTAGTLRDILINYINITIAFSSVAIAARGIQNDLLVFFFCVPSGLGRTLITMTGIYHGANDLQGLKELYSYAIRLGLTITGSIAAVVFAFAPSLVGLYTGEPEVLSLAVFSIRCMSVALVFDTIAVLIQHFLQGIGDLRQANLLSFFERFIVPVSCAILLSMAYGSKGLLSSVALSKLILVLLIFLANFLYYKKLPRTWKQLMFLPDEFGGSPTDNLYVRIGNVDDAIKASAMTQQFILDHQIDRKKAMLTGLFVEEMAMNVLDHAKKKKTDDIVIDFRLLISDTAICFSMTDLGDLFDPTSFYELHRYDSPEEHIGIRMVMNTAKEVRYFSTFSSNNLIVSIDR